MYICVHSVALWLTVYVYMCTQRGTMAGCVCIYVYTAWHYGWLCMYTCVHCMALWLAVYVYTIGVFTNESVNGHLS